jgi:hypothetical protein
LLLPNNNLIKFGAGKRERKGKEKKGREMERKEKIGRKYTCS